jgi:hypothetical protein
MKSKEFVVAGAALTLVTYVLALSLAGQALSATPPSSKVYNAGNVITRGIGVYCDHNCTENRSSIDWGELEPGSSESVTCYIKNELSSPSTLSMNTSDWDPPEAQDYLTLVWDYGNQLIDVREVVQVTFTLHVDASIEGITSFFFYITIAANSPTISH